MNSTWDDVQLPEFPSLNKNSHADVVIVGGGLTGLLSAYTLSRSGKKVMVLEKNRLAEGATFLTTGFLTESLDTDPNDLIKIYGKHDARLIMQSHEEAIDLIEQIVEREKINCEFKRVSNIIYTASAKKRDVLYDESAALEQLGVSTRIHHTHSFGFSAEGALEIKNQAKYHPRKFIAGLLRVLESRGVLIFENTEVTKATHCSVTTKDGWQVDSTWIVSATYSPLGEPKSLYLKKGMYVSYVLELSIPSKTIAEATYEDTENPYHYFRVDTGETSDRIIVGGEDHRANIPLAQDKSFLALEEYVEETFGHLPYSIIRRWRGPILEPSDGLPLIGLHEGILYASAFSGNGMTYAGIAATLFDAIIHTRPLPWTHMYRPGRLPKAKALLLKGRDYGAELLHGALKNAFKKRRP